MAFQWVEDVKTVTESVMEIKTRMDTGGLWYVFTGNHFTESLANFALYSADILMGVGAVCGLFGMAGSKRGAKGVYWSCVGYLVVNIVARVYT